MLISSSLSSYSKPLPSWSQLHIRADCSLRHYLIKHWKKNMALIVAVALILGVFLSVLFLAPRNRKSERTGVAQSNINDRKASKTYSKAEVSLHNKRTDCWIVIKNKVYDVTSYVEEHPGGDAILTHAGDDSTEGFYGPQHATRVFDMIDDFYIGDVEH